VIELQEMLRVARTGEGYLRIDQDPPGGGVSILLSREVGAPPCAELRVSADELLHVVRTMTGTLIVVQGQMPDLESIAAVPRPGPWEVKVTPPALGHEMVGLTFVLIDPPVQGRRALVMMKRDDARELMAALAVALDGSAA